MQISFLRNGPPPPVLVLRDTPLESVTSLPLLGVTLQSDLKWDIQVKNMVSRAARRLYILCNLKRNGICTDDLIMIYKMYIRPLLEFAAPVWSSSITSSQKDNIERVQRRALRMIAFPQRMDYDQLLQTFNVQSLANRRTDLLITFGKSLLHSDRHRDLLPPTRIQIHQRTDLRNPNNLHIPRTRTQRYKLSSIPSIVQLLNSE